MKCEVKRLKDGKWSRINAEEILNKSMANFVAEEFERVVAKITVSKDHLLYICNNEKDIEIMDKRIEDTDSKGLSIHVNDVIDFLGSQICHPVVAEVFPDSEFFELKKLEPEKE